MGTGPRQLWAANLGFGKWLQRCTERGEPEGRRPRGWGPSFLSFRGVRWQWSRPVTSRFPATGSPGPGLRELRQRAALLGRWLCKIRGHGGDRDSPTIPITFGSSRTQNGQCPGLLCTERRGKPGIAEAASRRLAAARGGCVSGVLDGVPCVLLRGYGGRISALGLPNRAWAWAKRSS